MSFKLAGSGAIIAKAGRFANTSIQTSGAILAQASDEAEAFINAFTRFKFTDNTSTLNASTSSALQEAAACLAGISLIAYDMSGYTTRSEAESLINVLNYKAFRILDLIKEDPQRKFLIDGSSGVL